MVKRGLDHLAIGTPDRDLPPIFTQLRQGP
jgi:hypothetical protein